MSNVTELKKNIIPEETKKIDASRNEEVKKNNKSITPDEFKGKKKKHNSSALQAASMGRSAVGQVKGSASADVSGGSGLSNTEPVANYEGKD